MNLAIRVVAGICALVGILAAFLFVSPGSQVIEMIMGSGPALGLVLFFFATLVLLVLLGLFSLLAILFYLLVAALGELVSVGLVFLIAPFGVTWAIARGIDGTEADLPKTTWRGSEESTLYSARMWDWISIRVRTAGART